MRWLAVLFVALLALVIYVAYLYERDWEAYAVQHHCRVSGKMNGSLTTSYMFDGKGNVTPVFGSEPDRTIYTCDAGEIQIR